MRRFVSALAQALDETSNNPRRGRGHDPVPSGHPQAPLNPQVQSNPYLAVLEPPQTSPFIGQPSDELVHRPYATSSSYADDDSDSDENVTLPTRAISTSPYPRHHPSRSNQSANPITSLRPSVSSSALSGAPNLSPESVSSVHRDFRSENPGKPALRKILSLDGGGVRGLSTILILKSLMYYLGRQRGKKLEPWQEFDLIGGTSTGGLLAIMLGRLRMSLDDCEAAYLNISRRIFQPIRHRANMIGQAVDFLQANGKFDAAKLEDCIKEILVELKKDQDMLLKEDDDKACKVFVCAVTGYESTAVIRSYDIGRYDQLFDICRIWEAARATSAASTLFDPITIGPYQRKFVDGALRHNNPINLVDLEASDLWPDDEKLIISVGTGNGPGGSVTGNLADLIQTLKRIATDTEEKNNIFRLQHPQMVANDRLFRFNVYHGLSQVGLAEHEAVDRIADFTQQYVDQEETISGIKKCVTSMITGGQRLNIAGQQEESSRLRKEALAQNPCVACLQCRKVIPFFSQVYYCLACQIRVCTSCHPTHDPNHLSFLVHAEIRPYPNNNNSSPPDVSETCTICLSLIKKCKLQCKACSFRLCLICAGQLGLAPISHGNPLALHVGQHPAHKHFVLMLSSVWRIKQLSPDFPTTGPGIVGCCHRCSKPTRIGDKQYWCRTCFLENGASQMLCNECYGEEDARHRRDHDFGFVRNCYEDDGTPAHEEIQNLFRCPRCPAEKINMASMSSHEHKHLELVLRPFTAEMRAVYGTRLRILMGMDPPSEKAINPTTLSCTVCGQLLGYERPCGICLISGCRVAYCTSCMQLDRCDHRHTLYDIVLKAPSIGAQYHGFMINCSYCGRPFPGPAFIGIECAGCFNHRLCEVCLFKSTTTPTITVFPPGLRHWNCSGDGNKWWGYVIVPPGWPFVQQFALHQQFQQVLQPPRQFMRQR